MMAPPRIPAVISATAIRWRRADRETRRFERRLYRDVIKIGCIGSAERAPRCAATGAGEEFL
jgi:hypothetical protein